MRLEIASSKAIRYACMNFHYAKSIPMVQIGFSVFNKNNEWCGVICYSIGANNNISKPYGLNQGQVCELVRMALNGKQQSTSKAMAISIKLLHKYNPLLKLVVSYADTEQGHSGIIYQACNWYYTESRKGKVPILNGKRIHKRTYSSVYGSYAGVEMVETKPKHKYIYPLDKSLVPMCKRMAKPYPKKLSEGVESNADSRLDAKRVTTTLPSHDGDAKI